MLFRERRVATAGEAGPESGRGVAAMVAEWQISFNPLRGKALKYLPDSQRTEWRARRKNTVDLLVATWVDNLEREVSLSREKQWNITSQSHISHFHK